MKRSNKKLRKAFPFGRINPITSFEQLLPGDVVILYGHSGLSDDWLFWMDGKGDLYTDMATGKFDLEGSHNHWIDGQLYPLGSINIKAVGLMTATTFKGWAASGVSGVKS
ncbi:MAG: hypothetical protein ACRC8R_12070 [Aeromonas hydrophila]